MPELRRLLRDIEVFAGDGLPSFDPYDTPEAPEDLFVAWLGAALEAGVREPHAMTLSTVTPDGRPAARTLILKNVGADGWEFAVHAGSPKGQDLATHGWAALTFYWSQQARQVRVHGPVAAAPAESAAADFLARSPGARAEALLGLQSTTLPDLATRDRRAKESLVRVEREPGLVTPAWTLYALRGREVEFWQGDRDRRHTRLVYRRAGTDRPDGSVWDKDLLWP